MRNGENGTSPDGSVAVRLRNLARRFRRDASGAYLVSMAIAMPTLIGTAGLGTEEGIWLYQHHKAQSAADAAAISAATAYGASVDSDVKANARSVAAQYGFANGALANNTSVTVNQPPTSGPHMSAPNAVEVIVNTYQPRLLSMLFGKAPVRIEARSVALSNVGEGCVLSLDKTAGGAQSLQGNATVSLVNCTDYDNSSSSTALSLGGTASMAALAVYDVGNISGESHLTTTKGINTGASATADPYASVSYPSYSGCNYNHLSEKSTVTLNPGVYCNGLSVNAGANVTFAPGTYYFDQGTFKVNGSATITGTNVTWVFTSSTGSNYATLSINGGANVSLSAPSSGALSGIAIFGDRDMPVGTNFSLAGGGSQSIVGAIYLPEAALSYAGGAATSGTGAAACVQLVADTISFVGNSTLQINCAGDGTGAIGSRTASLAE